MKKLSKILILVLAVALICTGLVLAVSADGAAEIEYTFDLATAVSEAGAGSTVTLTGNAKSASAITVDKNLTIDLNGYTLASSAAVLFEVGGDVEFTVTGTGALNVDGMIFRTASGKAPTVNIIGTAGTSGMDINHTGTASVNIAYAYGGVCNFKNINVLSTVSGGTQWESFFMMEKSLSAAGAKMYFDEMYFKCDTVSANNPGQSVFQLSGKGYISIKNSQVYSTSTVLVGGYSNAASDSDTILDVVDSVLYAHPKHTTQRAYCMLFSYGSDWDNNADVKGIVNLENSFFNGSYRVFVTGHTQASEGGHDLVFNATDSVIQCGGANTSTSNDAGADLARGRKIKLNITGNSVYASRSLAATVNGSKLTAGAGVRTNSTSKPSFPSDGTYTVVYDPIGNKDYPYVVVKTHDASGNAIEGAITAATYSVGTGNYLFVTGFEDLRTTGGRDLKGWFQIDGSSAGMAGALADKSELASKRGSLGESYVNGDTYLKYYVNPLDPANPTATRTFINEVSNNNDPFFVMGGKRLDDNKDSVGIEYRYASGANRAKVVVVDMDFAADSAFGYSEFKLKINARKRYTPASGDNAAVAGGSPYQNGKAIYIDNQGNITTEGGFVAAENHATKLNDLGEWNHVTAVCYTDPGIAQGRVYWYINDSYIGYSTIYNDNYCYIQGIRVDVRNDIPQVVGSSIVFDNLMVRAYADYIDPTKESDGTGAAGTHLPESYLLDFMTAEKQSDVGTSVIAGGRTFDDLDEAFAYAAEKKVNVKLSQSLFEQTVCENGTVFANGYDVPVNSDSYGYVIDGDKYTFSDDYWYNAYWYNGPRDDAFAMVDDANYVKEVVKLGFPVDHESLFTEETPDYDNLQIVTQDGWAYNHDASEKITAFVPGLAELEIAKQDGNRAVRFYPVITALDMTYVIKNSDGTVYDGGLNNADATAALKSLANGDTFVLIDDIALTESNLLFASTADAPKVLNIDLAGNTLARTVSGVLMQVGAYTTLNVYSSAEGGKVVAALANVAGAINDGGTCFVISDGQNNSAHIDASQLVGTRGEVTEAYINVGKFGDIPGSNMTVVAERAYYGFKGGENCRITVDGVTTIAPGSAGTTAAEAYVYDGDIFVKNGILLVPEKDNVVNLTGFSLAGNGVGANKNAGPRMEGFENFIITSYVEFENMIIINKLSGLSNGANNNIVSNNGDSSNLVEGGTDHVALKFKNVVTTGRFNPSNEAGRTRTEGFVAAETHDFRTLDYAVPGTKLGLYNDGMTWNLIGELGIVDEVLAFNIPAYSATEGGFINANSYNVANYGASVSGLENAYILPILNYANAYAEDIVYVNWKNPNQSANAKSEAYVKGGKYIALADSAIPSGGTVNLNAVKLIGNKTWTGIPAAGTVLNANVDITCGYTVEANVTGIKANLSLYSDFMINLYIPESYASYVKVGGAALSGETVTLGDVQYYRLTERCVAKNAANDVTFTLEVTEGEYTATKTINISISDYASVILAGEYSNADKILMYYMLSYIKEAAVYFGSAAADAEALLNNEAYAAFGNQEISHEYANALDDTGLGTYFTAAGVVLEDAPAFVLVPAGNFAGTVTATYGDGNVREYEVEAGSKTAIKIEGMKIYNFGTNVRITVTDANGEVLANGTVNLDTYADYHTYNAEYGTDDSAFESYDALALIEALYDYVKVAEAYKAETLVG